MTNLIELSKQIWNVPDSNIENINAGSLQRIAAATEAMSKNYVEMQRDLNNYKRWYDEMREQRNERDKTIVALKGHITRLKNKIDHLQLQTSNNKL